MTDNISIKDGFKWLLVALTCPCHVLLLSALLAGTVLGGFISRNLVLLFAGSTLLFAGSLWLCLRSLNRGPGNLQAFLPSHPLQPESSERAALSTSSNAEAGGAEPITPIAPVAPVRVQILKTPGCASCDGVERSWSALRPRYDALVEVEVVDLLEQPELALRYGVLRSPAVVIEGRLRAQGALDVSSLRLLLDGALRERQNEISESNKNNEGAKIEEGGSANA